MSNELKLLLPGLLQLRSVQGISQKLLHTGNQLDDVTSPSGVHSSANSTKQAESFPQAMRQGLFPFQADVYYLSAEQPQGRGPLDRAQSQWPLQCGRDGPMPSFPKSLSPGSVGRLWMTDRQGARVQMRVPPGYWACTQHSGPIELLPLSRPQRSLSGGRALGSCSAWGSAGPSPRLATPL